MAGKRRVFGAAFKAKVALAAAKGDRTTAQLASQFGIHTSQVTAWKKQLMAQVAELFADGRQRRADQATDSVDELYSVAITGGTPVTDPPEYYYTGDHYNSFCLITDAKGR